MNTKSDIITYSYDCEGCSLCNIDCNSNGESRAFFYNTQFKTQFNNFEMILENVTHNEHNTFMGNIKLTSPINAFNNASYQCYTRLLNTKIQTYETQIIFETDIEFEMYEDKIIIKLDQVIVM